MHFQINIFIFVFLFILFFLQFKGFLTLVILQSLSVHLHKLVFSHSLSSGHGFGISTMVLNLSGVIWPRFVTSGRVSCAFFKLTLKPPFMLLVYNIISSYANNNFLLEIGIWLWCWVVKFLQSYSKITLFAQTTVNIEITNFLSEHVSGTFTA